MLLRAILPRTQFVCYHASTFLPPASRRIIYFNRLYLFRAVITAYWKFPRDYIGRRHSPRHLLLKTHLLLFSTLPSIKAADASRQARDGRFRLAHCRRHFEKNLSITFGRSEAEMVRVRRRHFNTEIYSVRWRARWGFLILYFLLCISSGSLFDSMIERETPYDMR